VVKVDQAPTGRWYGGIDFGLRNPFAAVWGVLDRDEVLWLVGEHYARDKPLAYHARHLQRSVTWDADPEGAREIKELLCAGFAIRKGDNPRRPGIAAVRARLENGTLKVLEGACPNLLAEAQLYRYESDTGRSEEPVKEHDHALDALRYLISKLDWKKMVRMRKGEALEDAPPGPEAEPPAEPTQGVSLADQPAGPKRRPWLSLRNEALWTPLE
jgi:Terminase RNaseH-like domain